MYRPVQGKHLRIARYLLSVAGVLIVGAMVAVARDRDEFLAGAS